MPAIRVYVHRRRLRRAAQRAQRVQLPSARGAPAVAEVNWRRVLAEGQLIGWRSELYGWWYMPADPWLD